MDSMGGKGSFLAKNCSPFVLHVPNKIEPEIYNGQPSRIKCGKNVGSSFTEALSLR